MRPISLLFANVSSDTFCCRSVDPSAGARIVICTVAEVLRGRTLICGETSAKRVNGMSATGKRGWCGEERTRTWGCS